MLLVPGDFFTVCG